MNVDLTSDQEARIARYASRTGKDPEEIVREAIDLMLGDAGFVEAVEEGIAELDRGDYIEHEEIGKRLAKLFRD